jgi:hypothetical protein
VEDQNEGLFEQFIHREIQAMEIFLVSKATKTGITLEEYIHTRQLLGASDESIEADLLKDLEEGGRIFGDFRNSIRATSNGIINRARDVSIFADIGIDTKYRWVAVLVNTCPDCLERHNKTKPWEEWEAEGLPRTGQTVCKENCRCVLLPSSTLEIDPIKRSKR